MTSYFAENKHRGLNKGQKRECNGAIYINHLHKNKRRDFWNVFSPGQQTGNVS